MAQAQRLEPANDTATAGQPAGHVARLREPDLSPPTTADAPPAKRRRRRSVLMRLFGISVFGWLRLTILCVLVGFVVMAVNFDPRTVEVDVSSTVDTLVRNTVTAGTWLIRNFWRPALAGATVVLPLWVLWRLVSLPFRR